MSNVYDNTVFQTTEGWNEFYRRIGELSRNPTHEEHAQILRDVQMWEQYLLSSFRNEQEYQEAIKADEIYRKLIECEPEEGSKK